MQTKILNLNCWLLPRPLSIDNNERIEKIIRLIKRTRPDIVTLQEVWMKKYVKIFMQELRDYHFYYNKNRGFNKSGLLTATLEEPLLFCPTIFPITKNHSIVEKIAKKGYHKVHMKGGLIIFNTHLYAPRSEQEIKITKEQFDIIKRHSTNKIAVICGDLNLGNKDLGRFFKNKNSNTIMYPNKYQKSRFNNTFSYKQKIDFILERYPNIKSKIKILNEILSDHYPQMATITWREK